MQIFLKPSVHRFKLASVIQGHQHFKPIYYNIYNLLKNYSRYTKGSNLFIYEDR